MSVTLYDSYCYNKFRMEAIVCQHLNLNSKRLQNGKKKKQMKFAFVCLKVKRRKFTYTQIVKGSLLLRFCAAQSARLWNAIENALANRKLMFRFD